LIETKCQYRGEGGEHVSVLAIAPYGRGAAPSFYRPRGGSLQSCRTVLITCGGMVYSVVELMEVPANLVPAGRRGESYSHLGVASRVAVWGLPVRSSSVR
jgi:hypothetical protein